MKVLLYLISKNDENYILEWVEHYINIGINHIIIYNNSIIDNYTNILKDYINKNIVTIDDCVLNKPFINNDTCIEYKNAQSYVYNKCYNENYNNYDYICFFDSDEFLIFEKFTNINDFLSQDIFNNYDCIRICWKIYDDNNIIIPKTYSVKQFTNFIDTNMNRICKSIIKCDKKFLNKWITAHGLYNISACDALGNPCWNKAYHDNIFIGEHPILSGAWINHYRYKTISEYVLNKQTNMIAAGLYEYDLDIFFKINQKTPGKLEYLKSIGIDYK